MILAALLLPIAVVAVLVLVQRFRLPAYLALMASVLPSGATKRLPSVRTSLLSAKAGRASITTIHTASSKRMTEL